MKLNLAEGTFGNLASLAAAKLGGDPGDRLRVRSDQKLHDLVRKARTFRYHLFDRRAEDWWKEVFDHFEIPEELRTEIIKGAKNEFIDRLDRSLFEADLSKVIDMLNPRTRESATKSAARSATAEKLATAIIGYVAKAAERMTPTQKKKAGKIPKAPPVQGASAKGPKVKKWKKKPPNEVIEKAMAIAKRVIRARGPAREELMRQLTDIGFRIDWDTDPPRLRIIR